MSINTSKNYKVRIVDESNILSEDNETIYDNIFVNSKTEDEIIINGKMLLSSITELLTDGYTTELKISDKELHFEIFNYTTGETESISFYIEEI